MAAGKSSSISQKQLLIFAATPDVPRSIGIPGIADKTDIAQVGSRFNSNSRLYGIVCLEE
jgi:hypothetical protein